MQIIHLRTNEYKTIVNLSNLLPLPTINLELVQSEYRDKYFSLIKNVKEVEEFILLISSTLKEIKICITCGKSKDLKYRNELKNSKNYCNDIEVSQKYQESIDDYLIFELFLS